MEVLRKNIYLGLECGLSSHYQCNENQGNSWESKVLFIESVCPNTGFKEYSEMIIH